MAKLAVVGYQPFDEQEIGPRQTGIVARKFVIVGVLSSALVLATLAIFPASLYPLFPTQKAVLTPLQCGQSTRVSTTQTPTSFDFGAQGDAGYQVVASKVTTLMFSLCLRGDLSFVTISLYLGRTLISSQDTPVSLLCTIDPITFRSVQPGTYAVVFDGHGASGDFDYSLDCAIRIGCNEQFQYSSSIGIDRNGAPGAESTFEVVVQATNPANTLRQVKFSTCGSSFDTDLTIYRDSALTQLLQRNNDAQCSNAPSLSLQSVVTATLPIGTYQAVVDGVFSGSGTFSVSCSECLVHTDCALDRYCQTQGNTCVPKQAFGTACAQDAQCAGSCLAGICGQCVTDADCARISPDRYCDVFSRTCRAKLRNGVQCGFNNQCLLNKCTFNICGDCSQSSQCSTTQYCETPAYFAPSFRCLSKFDLLVPCQANEQCLSNKCMQGLCSNCVVDTDCPSSQFCDTTSRNCFQKRAPGGACAANNQCLSGSCRLGVCICVSNAECLSGSFCDSSLSVPICRPKFLNLLPCTSSAQCISGICSNSLCRQCVGDGNCGSSAYCDQNVCQSKKTLGAICSANNVCQSNACFLGLCRGCLDDSYCSSVQFCEPVLKSCIAKRPSGGTCTSSIQCMSGSCRFVFCA